MEMVYSFMIVATLSFLVVYIITPLIIKFANKVNFLDNPEARKVHKKATPLLGGLSIFIGFFVLAILIIYFIFDGFPKEAIGFLIGALIIVIVGIIDDKIGMNPFIKMFGQTIAFTIFIVSNDLYGIFGSVYLTVPILFLWVVGLMNALNFLDNMDGIISGMAGILALGFYGFGYIITKTSGFEIESHYLSLLSLAFAGALLGFLPYNFNPAKIFLGDAGSMFIGYFLATMGILSGKLVVARMAGNNLYFLLPILLLSYAIFDISLVSIIRKRDGRKISQGGKDHSTHRIGNAMKSHKITAIIVYLINIIIVLVTLLIFMMESTKLLIIATVLFALIFILFGRKLDQIPVVIPEINNEK
jgi:UDP-GlcNAc:undecaprenyl-phosphate/decaprenyl-phosphate GlcNAc-1-phosphate transferase